MTNDLLERRAERGTPRGAANVWANAQETPPTGYAVGNWGFRFATVGLLALATLGMFFLSRQANVELDTVDEPSAIDEPVPTTSNEPLPPAIGVDGMEPLLTIRPEDPEFDADDLFGPRPPAAQRPGFDSDLQVQFFAREDEPFVGPILGVLVFEDGEYMTFEANMDSVDQETLLNQIRVVDGRATLSSSSELTAVSSVSTNVFDDSDYGWRFEFSDAQDGVSLSARTLPDGGASVWEWLGDVIPPADEGIETTVRPIAVRGVDGAHITYGNGEPDEVVWSEGRFAFRLRALSIDDTQTTAGADALARRLTTVDRADWVVDVQATDSENVPLNYAPTLAERLVIIMVLLLGVVFLIMMVIPAIKILKDNYS